MVMVVKRQQPQPNENMNTKESALKKLIAAGYASEITANGLRVSGQGWEVHYDDRGQDWNTYSGKVPSEVETLAVWDDASTREEN